MRMKNDIILLTSKIMFTTVKAIQKQTFTLEQFNEEIRKDVNEFLLKYARQHWWQFWRPL